MDMLIYMKISKRERDVASEGTWVMKIFLNNELVLEHARALY